MALCTFRADLARGWIHTRIAGILKLPSTTLALQHGALQSCAFAQARLQPQGRGNCTRPRLARFLHRPIALTFSFPEPHLVPPDAW